MALETGNGTDHGAAPATPEGDASDSTFTVNARLGFGHRLTKDLEWDGAKKGVRSTSCEERRTVWGVDRTLAYCVATSRPPQRTMVSSIRFASEPSNGVTAMTTPPDK